METIQVVLDAGLLRAADRAARQSKLNRSALIRDALREHLKRLQTQDLEERDRRGYQSKPLPEPDSARWEARALWPDA